MTHDRLDSAYATLGLSRGASSSAVKRRYKALVKQWHPDRFTGDPQGVAEATMMLKAVNHAYSTILEQDSAQAFTHEQTPDSALHSQIRHSVDGHLTQAEIDDIVATIRHSESLLTVASGDIAGWRSRIASSLLALAYVASEWKSGESIRVLYWCLMPLLCIWFPDVLGRVVNSRITKPSPPLFVWFFGWVLLFSPLVAFGIIWLETR
jgi:DnaJ-domain-containing protein 1